MPSTRNFGWPTPEDTAQVANGPAIIRALGDAIDSTIGDKNIPDFSDDTPADGQVLTFDQAQGVYVPEDPTATPAGFTFVGTRIFTADGTFSKADPFGDGSFDGALMRAVRVRAVGGGGGGGGASTTGAGESSAGAGGGSGGFAESLILSSAIGSSEPVTVGLGGTGGAGVAGTVGGNTSFGSSVVGPGGVPGATREADTVPSTIIPSTTVPAAPTGDLTIIGAFGTPPLLMRDNRRSSGAGAESPLGGGGRPVGSGNGLSTDGFGGGGGGAANQPNQATARDGGDGGDGVVIVEVFA
jgi:hypothetical protein